jgi:hypothetical protein
LKEDARVEVQNYGGIDDLVYDTEDFRESALNAVSDKFRNDQVLKENLELLPYLYFGQKGEAELLMNAIGKAIGDQGQAELQAYFEKIRNVAAENPEIIQEFRGLVKKYIDETKTQDDMKEILDHHTLGDFIDFH